MTSKSRLIHWDEQKQYVNVYAECRNELVNLLTSGPFSEQVFFAILQMQWVALQICDKMSVYVYSLCGW